MCRYFETKVLEELESLKDDNNDNASTKKEETFPPAPFLPSKQK